MRTREQKENSEKQKKKKKKVFSIGYVSRYEVITLFFDWLSLKRILGRFWREGVRRITVLFYFLLDLLFVAL